MPNDVHVRRYRPTDAESLVALWHEVLPSSQPWNDPQTALARKVRQQDDLIFVAEKKAEVVGAVIAGYDGIRGWIYSLAVMPDHRICGIGRLLMREAEAALLALGCPKVNLQVRSTNSEVMEFYRRCGYELEDRSSLGRVLSSVPNDQTPQSNSQCHEL